MKRYARAARSGLLLLEWALLIGFGLMIAPQMLPVSDWLDHARIVREAKRDGVFSEGPSEKQTYFGRTLEVEGVIYGDKELRVLMKGCRFGPHGKLPSHAYLRADGSEFQWNQSSSGGGWFCGRGSFTFQNVPPDLTEAELRNEAYGESFSFQLDLGGGAS